MINMSELSLPDQQERIEAAIYPSPGACDEFIPLFLCQKRLTRRHMEWLKGKATGLRDEGENITLKLVPLESAWKEAGRDAKALAALALYEGLKREGRLPDMPSKVEDEPEEVRCS
jgi:ADP-sugar diphosphatase